MLLCCAGPEGWAAHRRLWRRKRQRCSDSDEQAEGNGGPAGSAPLGRAQLGAIPLDATYEDLLGGPYRPFTQPIQLQVRGLLGRLCVWLGCGCTAVQVCGHCLGMQALLATNLCTETVWAWLHYKPVAPTSMYSCCAVPAGDGGLPSRVLV